MRLQDKVAIVTGAASGFGAGIARKFVAEGARVIVADLNLQAALDLVAQLGTAARALRVDVSQAADVRTMFDAAEHHFGRLVRRGGRDAGSRPCVPGGARGPPTRTRSPYRIHEWSHAMTARKKYQNNEINFVRGEIGVVSSALIIRGRSKSHKPSLHAKTVDLSRGPGLAKRLHWQRIESGRFCRSVTNSSAHSLEN